MIGSLIGGALKVGGSIFGAIKASQAMKKYKKNIEKQMQENKDWYNRRYNEDATQRADAQRILTKTAEAIRDRNRAAAGTQAVMGGTDESVAAEKAANNQALAEAASTIAVAGDARKDRIEDAYRTNEANYQSQLNNMELQRANAVSKAVGGVASAAGGLGESIEDWESARSAANANARSAANGIAGAAANAAAGLGSKFSAGY